MAGIVPLVLILVPIHFPANLEKAEKEVSAPIRVEELKAHVYRLASEEFAGRQGPGAARTSRHIADLFKAMNLKPAFGDSYFQNVPDFLEDPTGEKKRYLGRNVGAILPGSDPALKDEWILLTAHFDHLGKRKGKLYPGADDNASGVAMLVEVAEKLASMKTPPKRTIVFVSFDLEEVGLLGSRYFATHPPMDLKKLKTFMTADMLGRSMANVMDEYVFVLGAESSKRLLHLVKNVPMDKGLKAGRMGADIVGTRSDYGPFRDRKVPFLFFTTGQNPDYHSPRDLPDRIDYFRLQKICRWITELTVKLANDAETPTWNPNPETDLAEVEVIHTLVSRVMKNPMAYPLSKGQRGLIGGIEQRLAAILDRGRITQSERTWLIWSSRLLLLSVF